MKYLCPTSSIMNLSFKQSECTYSLYTWQKITKICRFLECEMSKHRIYKLCATTNWFFFCVEGGHFNVDLHMIRRKWWGVSINGKIQTLHWISSVEDRKWGTKPRKFALDRIAKNVQKQVGWRKAFKLYFSITGLSCSLPEWSNVI